jgi:hypothetical protein
MVGERKEEKHKGSFYATFVPENNNSLVEGSALENCT